jgi:predicted RNase H-like HicB family nuclease
MSLMIVEAETEFPAVDVSPTPGPRAFLAVIEPGQHGWGAYVPDLPGVVAAAETEEEVRQLITEAVEFHLHGLVEEHMTVPPPSARAMWIAP